jgi:8-oxo-dGTP pyrophosphatase MutT (NUDIX family)
MAAAAPPVPTDSATVILLREPAQGACEVLLVERHAQSRTLAGAHVFPGGLVDAADSAPALLAASTYLAPPMAAARLGEDLAPPAALAFWIAAIRELFEETGILLATVEGAPLGFSDAARAARFRAHRMALLAGELSFAELVERERLRLATDRVEYFSRWITPVNAPRRYDARFFVAEVPADQEPVHDERETASVTWLAPAAALERTQAGALTLAPPTLRTLEDLRDLGSTARILEAARARLFPPILPKVVDLGGRMTILYPGDVAYARAVPGEPAGADAPGPRNRVVLEGGAWRSIRSRAP